MKNEYKVTKELMKSFAKEYHFVGKADIIYLILYVAVLIACIGLLVLSIIFHMGWLYTYLAFLFLLVSVYKLFFARRVIWSQRYKMLSTMHGVSEWMRSVEFTDDEIIYRDHKSMTVFKYGNIKKIDEKGNDVLIIFNDRLGIKIYKDTFVEGTWEECREKIESMKK